MTLEQRQKLVDTLSSQIIEGYDLDTLLVYAVEQMASNLNKLTDDELLAEMEFTFNTADINEVI